MIRGAVKILKRFYNENIESICTRILYFFNTLDSYFIIAGLIVWVIVRGLSFPSLNLVVAALLGASIILLSDLYPFFILSSIPAWLVLLSSYPAAPIWWILFLNVVVFVAVLYLFIGLPNSIISRDPRVGVIMVFNSLFTVAPTLVSFSMSVYFSSAYSLILCVAPPLISSWGGLFWFLLAIAAVLSAMARPRSYRSKFGRWPKGNKQFRRVVLLNIDGCSLNAVSNEGLSSIRSLERRGLNFPRGLITVYRALTNPAFSSILTSVTPREHGVKNNNFGQISQVEALPDYIPSILYGSMHVRHFSKAHWRTRIVSLPRCSIYRTDEIVFEWLKDDIVSHPEARLFIVDLSEMDFLGHCYGSYSRAYSNALCRTDERIGQFISWCKEQKLLDDTAIIICADHGLTCIDHSYLLFGSETYVPFILYFQGIVATKQMGIASIMDIGNTVAHLLGARYTRFACGKTLLNLSKERIQTEQFKYLVKTLYFLEEESRMEFFRKEISKLISEFLKNRRAISAAVVDYSGLMIPIASAVRKVLSERSTVTYYAPLDISSHPEIGIQDEVDCKPPPAGEPLSDAPLDLIFLCGLPDENVEAVFKSVDQSLKAGGYLIMLHEPRSRYYTSLRVRIFSRLMKRAGCTVMAPKGVVQRINERLSHYFKEEVRLRPEEVLETIDGLSPMDPWDSWRSAIGARNSLERHLSCYSKIRSLCYMSLSVRLISSGMASSSKSVSKIFAWCFGKGANAAAYVMEKASSPIGIEGDSYL